MKNLGMYDYNGYKLVVKGETVSVFDPRFKRAPAMYRTTSLDLAAKFVDAYRDGAHWAVEAAADAMKAG